MKQNNCQGCGCINEDQCICMKEEYTMHHPAGVDITFNSWDEYTTYHPAGVNITFNSWDEYNKYMVYENKVRKECCDQAYENGFFDGYNKAKGVETDQDNSVMYSDPYNDGYDEGYKNAKSDINHELGELKIKLADALQAQAFWRDKSNKDKIQSKLELPNPIEVKVKVNNVDEFIKIWDVLYPKEEQ